MYVCMYARAPSFLFFYMYVHAACRGPYGRAG